MSREKDLARMCANRVARLIELNAPANILKKEMEMLNKRIEVVLPQLPEMPIDPDNKPKVD